MFLQFLLIKQDLFYAGCMHSAIPSSLPILRGILSARGGRASSISRDWVASRGSARPPPPPHPWPCPTWTSASKRPGLQLPTAPRAHFLTSLQITNPRTALPTVTLRGGEGLPSPAPGGDTAGEGDRVAVPATEGGAGRGICNVCRARKGAREDVRCVFADGPTSHPLPEQVRVQGLRGIGFARGKAESEDQHQDVSLDPNSVPVIPALAWIRLARAPGYGPAGAAEADCQSPRPQP